MATASSSACAHDAHAAWGDPDDRQQSSLLTAILNAIVETAAACSDRLRTRLPSGDRACQVSRPAATTCPVLSRRAPHGSSPDGGKTSCAASRRDGPFRSHEKPRGANFRGGLAEYGNVDGVARDAAPSCADAATNPDRRGSARTASGAQFFRPVGHGSRSETSCRRRAGRGLSARGICEMGSRCTRRE